MIYWQMQPSVSATRLLPECNTIFPGERPSRPPRPVQQQSVGTACLGILRSPCSCTCRENPGTNGGAPRDKASFAKLLTETRAVFVAEARRTKRPRLQLSVAVPSALEYYRASYDVPVISKAVDLCVLTRPDSFSCTVVPLIQHLHQPDGDRGVVLFCLLFVRHSALCSATTSVLSLPQLILWHLCSITL